VGIFDDLLHVCRRHAPQRLPEGLVSARLLVFRDLQSLPIRPEDPRQRSLHVASLQRIAQGSELRAAVSPRDDGSNAAKPFRCSELCALCFALRLSAGYRYLAMIAS